MGDGQTSLLTVGELARVLGVPIHKVQYVLRTRAVKPSARVGNFRVFSQADAEYVASVLRRIDADRGRGCP